MKATPMILTTDTKGLSVKVSQRGSQDDLYLEGHGIDAGTGRAIHGTSVKRKLQTPESLKYVAAAVAHLVEQKYLSLTRTSPPKAHIRPDGFFTEALKTCTPEGIVLLHKTYCWSGKTFHSALTYCQNSLFPRLDQYGMEICEEDIHTIQEELIQKAEQSKRGNRNRADAERSVAAQLYRADYIYQRLREVRPDLDLPKLDLTLDRPGPRIQTEQCKALPDKVRIQFAHLLFRLLTTPAGGLALAAALMLFCGLRTSEATGVIFSDIRYHGLFGSLFVCQQEQNGDLTRILKTENAYRNVILPKIMLDFLGIRDAYLQSLGYIPEQFKELPIACINQEPEALAHSNAVSALARELLQLCGLSDEFFQAVRELADREPDEVGGEKVRDVAAYTLRRDWGTRACHICGFSMDQVDYLLGHAAKSKQRKDYLTLEKQAELAWQLERYVFDPSHSAHPAATPQVLRAGLEKGYPVSQAFRFHSDEQDTLEITYSFECAEPGDTVSIILPPGVTPEFARHLRQDTPSLRQNRPLIGALLSKEMSLAWIQEAEQIDLSKWEGS